MTFFDAQIQYVQWEGIPFDHRMHFRHVMTLESGNDALLCKAF